MATDNEIYDPDVQLIFWDEPLLGAYPRRFRHIKAEPRYSDIQENLRYFAQLYRGIQADRRPLSWHLARRSGQPQDERDEFSSFYIRYYDYIARQSAKLDALLGH
jgi:hypothetical protein